MRLSACGTARRRAERYVQPYKWKLRYGSSKCAHIAFLRAEKVGQIRRLGLISPFEKGYVVAAIDGVWKRVNVLDQVQTDAQIVLKAFVAESCARFGGLAMMSKSL